MPQFGSECFSGILDWTGTLWCKMVELPFSQNCASLFKSASVTFPVPVSRIHSLSFSHKFFVDSHHVYKKKVISILILDFGK